MTDARATLDAYATATDAHDLVGTVRLVHDEAVYWFSDATSYVGVDAIEAALVSNFSAISDEQYVIDHHRWVVETDDAAVCLYRWSWHGLINGVPSKGTGRGTTVLARQASG